MTIHKEGRTFLLRLCIILVFVIISLNFLDVPSQVLSVVYLLMGGLLLFCLQFFRNPSIRINKNPKQVLAPADGTVVVVEQTEEEEYLKDQRVQISIFMSPVDKHINRNPVSGKINYLKYHAGHYLVAWHPKASTDNERNTVVYQLADGVEILIRQIAGAMARRIRYYVSEQDEVEQGDEFGFIKFGSRVDVFLPLEAKILIERNQRTKAGITVLAELA